MFCTWKVSTANTNCSQEFLLEYNLKKDRTSYCVPENVPLSDSRSPTECICYISVEYFVSVDIYYIQVKSHDGSSQNTIIKPSDKVKPKTPVNVTIEHGEDETVLVCWDSRYSNDHFLFRELIFEVQTSAMQDPKEIKVTTLHQGESCYRIKKRQFRRRQDYTVRVRSKPYNDYNGIWSEWSSAAVWHNDYDLLFHDKMVILIPSSALVILICILLCSVFSCFFKKWLNTIPNPGRSQLLSTMMNRSQGPELKSDINKSFCENCKMLISRNQGKTKQNSGILITPRPQNLFERAGVKAFFVIPEITIAEKPTDISPLRDDTHSINEPAEEDEARDHGMECDIINQMFHEILDGIEAEDIGMDNTDGLEKPDPTRFTFLAEFCHKSSLQTTPELVNSDYTNGNVPINTSQNVFCFDEKFGNQTDYFPELYTGSTHSHSCSIDTYMDYSCFAGGKDESEFDEPKCLQSTSSGDGIYHKTEPVWFMPKTCVDQCQTKPLWDQYNPVENNETTNSTKVSSCLYQVSDYQSFNTAIVNQGHSLTAITYAPTESGYKPFLHQVLSEHHNVHIV
ncbi:interleukin-4 receptor subunit alpha [Dendropsophus ebraccatus]|uniref:interleukin-4 receptor subunit alpha n=1 Tax=Dendropsophus ebraccatus TaxID=150705 RepID=UPI003831EB4C